MPIYEYICADCQKPAEILIRNTRETPLCPHCGSAGLKKQVSVPGAVLVGHGQASMPCGQNECPASSHSCGMSSGCCGGHK